MPGVFDCHDHVAFSTVDMNEVLSTPVTQWALETAANARVTLEAGVTFVRDLCGADRGLRDGIAAGYVPGPELQIAVVLICQTGGHGDAYLRGAGLETTLTPDYPGRPPYVVDGADSMRHAVRAVLRAGADWIKLATTGGLVSEHDQPLVAELTPEEIAVAVFEAGRKGKPVSAHAYGGDGLTNAVVGGVRSIEHGGFLTEEQAALMAERGCFLVPTLSAMRDCLRWAEDGALTPTQCRKILELGLDLGSCVRIAKEYGVPIASGCDYISREQHGKNLEELTLMHQAGLTVEETLLAATAGGAELCGVLDDRGRIEPGFVFDAVVLDQDPGDLSCFAEPGSVTGVFRAGRPAVRHPRVAGAMP
jgi:imidazolonepropionase-like amidohydrolase